MIYDGIITNLKLNHMKIFTKIFVVAAALFAGVACTTDATEDLGVAVGGKTTLTISLEESRTQLGEKVDGVYPLYWSEGDQISVNGVASDALSAAAEGSATASFNFDGVLSHPYNIVYPASSLNEVTFPAAQSFKEGTFCAGAAPMYGYAASAEESIQMYNLAGVLRIAVSGDKTLSSVVLEAEQGNLAGTFAVDCATGALTLVEGTGSKSVAYTLGEGLALGATATPLYIAVPAGNYGKVLVSLYAVSGEKMVLQFDTTEKPILAGMVREFGAFEYVGSLGSEFIIDSVDALIAFAANPTKDARVTANLDLTGVEWTSIEGFAHTFDGGNFEIKGLTAPLFGGTSGSFKNVKLVDVNIVETVNPNVGALARYIQAPGADPLTVDNCSVSGKLYVNVTGFVPAVKEVLTDAAVGSLIGYIGGVHVSNCHSSAELDIHQVYSASTSLVVITCGGGIVGYVRNAEDTPHTASVSNCTNRGAVNYTNAVEKLTISARIGGVIGAIHMNTLATGLTNRGDVTIKGPFGSTHSHNFGGIIGWASQMTCNNSKNYGTLSISGGYFGALNVGGISGYFHNCAGTELHNYGPVSVADDVVVYQTIVGGAIGRHTGYSDVEFSILSNVSNNATVTVLSSMSEEAATAGYYHVGGTVAWSQNNDHDIVNNKEGVVTVKSNLINAEKNTYNLSIGGCVGYQTQNGPSNITNHAAMNIHCVVTTLESYTDYDLVRLCVGGGIGYANAASDPMVAIINSGDISVYAHAVGCLRVGGTMAQTASGEVSDSVNSGKIIIKEGTTTVKDLMMIGGNIACVGGTAAKTLTNTGDIIIEKGLSCGNKFSLGGNVGWTNQNLTTLRNSGNITLQGGTAGALSSAANDDKILNVGGNVGWVDVKRTMKDMENSGDITLNGVVAKYTMSVAGNVARYNTNDGMGGSGTDLKNSGAITIDEKSSTGGGLYVGGCVAIHQVHNSGNFTNCENDAPLTVKPSVSGNVYIGGVAGYLDGGTDRTLTNTKNGKVFVQLAKTVAGKTYAIGGVAGRMVDHSNPLTNYGDIEIKGTVAGTAFVSGIIGYPNNYNRVNILNDCTITLDAEFTSACRVGGICGGGSYGAVYGNAHNAGKIHATKNSKFKGETYIGGFFGEAKSEYLVVNDCSNSAEILFEGESGVGGAATASLNIGGLFGHATKLRSVQHGYTNSGNITFAGTHSSAAPVYIGGIFGHNEAPINNDEAFPVYTKGTAVVATQSVDGKDVTVTTTTTDPIYHECKVVNKGDVTCSGTSTGEIYVGGWAGYTAHPFLNAAVFCSVQGGKSNNVGMLMGIPYADATKATKSQVGGVFVGEYDEVDKIFKRVEIDGSNYFEYIYSAPIDENVAVADECTYISSIEE